MINNLITASYNTLLIYLPSWMGGTILGILVSAVIWRLKHRISYPIYIIISGLSFVPVVVLIPYFIRTFGLNVFIYPLLALPVFLMTTIAAFESYKHANLHRYTLLVNYKMSRSQFFWKVVFREAIPYLQTSIRQTLSLAFAICLALDYFMENWRGLGALISFYYGRLFMAPINHWHMLISIIISAILGALQIFLLSIFFHPLTKFRKHY